MILKKLEKIGEDKTENSRQKMSEFGRMGKLDKFLTSLSQLCHLKHGLTVAPPHRVVAGIK